MMTNNDDNMFTSDKEDFTKRLDEASDWAKESGYKEENVNDIVKTYRKNKDDNSVNIKNSVFRVC